jgi:serine/threonine-protein kinase RsbW
MAFPQIHSGEPSRPGHCVFARSYPSRIDRKQAIIDEIATEFTSRGWVGEEDLQWLYLCLDEVVVNAMLHGNEGDPDLMMSVSLYQDGDRWVLIVADQGDGFSTDVFTKMEDPQSLLLEHGRGIRIMCEWLDQIAYYRQGAVAVLSRRIPVSGAT